MQITSKSNEELLKEIERLRLRLEEAEATVEAIRSGQVGALQESQEQFRSTFEQAAVGITHLGSDGRRLRINRKLCDIVGYGHDEVLGMTFRDITHPDDLEGDLANVRRLLAGEITTYSMEKRYVRKDRSTVAAAAVEFRSEAFLLDIDSVQAARAGEWVHS